MSAKSLPLRTLTACCLLGAASLVHAVPFTSNLDVEATTSYYDDPFDRFTDAAGSLTHTAGGADTSTTFGGDSSSGPNPLGPTTLTDTGDGVVVSATGSASDPNTQTDEFGDDFDAFYTFGVDHTLTLTNIGPNVIVVDIRWAFDLTVEATGPDAFAEVNNFEIFETTPTGDPSGNTLPITDILADTLDGDPASDADSDSGLLSYLLNPGDVVQLDAVLDVFGAAYDGTGSFDVGFSLTIDSVEERIPPDPNPMPAPGILLLMALPLLHLRRIAKKAA